MNCVDNLSYSAGLFSKAICMSGTFTAPGHSPFQRSPVEVGRALAEELGCSDPIDGFNPTEVLKRLQSLRYH